MGTLLDPAVALPAAAVIGLCVGSFLNVVIHRLPKMMERGWTAQCAELAGREPELLPRYDLVVPRSACPSCGHRISAVENVPVASWLALRGKCSACKAPIPVRYPIIELAAGVAALAAIWHFGPTLKGLAACGFLWTLIALAFIDADTQLLPDDLTLPLLWAGLLANLFGLFVPLASAVIGAIAGYLTLWSIYWLFKLIRGKEGMGYGDFKLLAALGAWLGWPMLPQIVLLSSLLGAIGGIAAMTLRNRDGAAPLPFGPWLAGAGAIALFFGPAINALYLRVTLVVGLTGGIGSGKSAVAAAFGALGVPVVDADAIAHEISAPGREGYHAVVATFGRSVLAPDGTLDRARLRERAFGDDAYRRRLEDALHPPIRREIARSVAAWRAPYGILVVPLLLERGGAASLADRVLVVDCPEDEQVRRVVGRSGLAPAEVRAIMATQLPRAERLMRADDVLDNAGPPDAIAPAVARLDASYRALAAARGHAGP